MPSGRLIHSFLRLRFFASRVTSLMLSKVKKDVIVHPYYLLNRENKWFLLCRNETANRPEEIPLPTIKRIDVAEDVEFIPNEDFDYKDYYKKIKSVA